MNFIRKYAKSILKFLIPDDDQRMITVSLIRERGNISIWVRDPFVRQFARRLTSLKDKYKGERCFIMGNGPSLNVTPLEKLKRDYIWGVNRCNLLFDRISWRPQFYVAVDTRVVPDNADEISGLIHSLADTSFFFPIRFRLNNILQSKKNTFWYREILFREDKEPDGNFSLNIPLFVRSARTVILSALQLAVFLGFNPIYLIGCDTKYVIPKSVIHEDPQELYLIGTENDDINHFHQDYFGTGKKFHQPYPEKMMSAYRQAKNICDQIGVKIFNATVGGELEVFQRVNIHELF